MAHPPEWAGLSWAHKVRLAKKFIRSSRANWLQAAYSVSADAPETAWEAADAAREKGAESDADDLEAIAIAIEADQLKGTRRARLQVQFGTTWRQLSFPWGER
jgi:hypothetical protein